MKNLACLSLILYLFVQEAQSQLVASGCGGAERVVVCVSDIDCVNCQNLLNPIVGLLREKGCTLNFVFNGMPKRIVQEYYQSKIEVPSSTDNVIHYSNLPVGSLSWNGARSCIITTNALVTKQYKLDEYLRLLQQAAKPVFALPDSMDITAWWGSHTSKLYIDTAEGFFIYNDVRSTLYNFARMHDTVNTRFNLNRLMDKWNDSLIYYNTELDSMDKLLNHPAASTGPFQGTKSGQPYITDKYIYIPATKFFMKRNFFNDTVAGLVPYSFLFRMDKRMNLLNIYAFGTKLLESSNNLFTSLSYGHFINDTTFMMNTSSMNKDSLVAIIRLSATAPVVQSVVNITYPPYFKKISPNGYPVVYPLGYANTSRGNFYFLHPEHTMYAALPDSLIKVDFDFLDCPYGSDGYVEFVGRLGNHNIGVVNKNGQTTLTGFSDKTVLFSINIAQTHQVAGSVHHQLYTYVVKEDRVFIYNYRLL